MAYSDLSYYAYGRAPVAAKVATFVRERGLSGLAQAVSAATAASNIAGMESWIAAHPLPDNADDDARQTRALVVAAIAKAKSAGGDPAALAAASAAYSQAQQSYQRFAGAQYQKEMPSALALWLSNLGIDLSTAAGKVLAYGGLALAAYLVLPAVLQGMRGSKSA